MDGELAQAAAVPLETEYDKDEGDDDTEETGPPDEATPEAGDTTTPASRALIPPVPQPSIMKTFFGRLLGRRTSEA